MPSLSDGSASSAVALISTQRYVKLTRRDRKHGAMTFAEGLNADPLPFDPRPHCGPGGIFFCRPRDVPRWMGYREGIELMWDVELVPGAPVVHMPTKSKAAHVILRDARSLHDNSHEVLRIIAQDMPHRAATKDATLASIVISGPARHLWRILLFYRACPGIVRRLLHLWPAMLPCSAAITLAAGHGAFWSFFSSPFRSPQPTNNTARSLCY